MHKAGESQSLFQEGVCGSQAKIRPFVPKKTVQNDKDLARGSSVGNVTQEAPTRLLAVMSPGCPTVPRCAALQGPGKLRARALELVQATLYLQAAECKAGREAEVSTGSTA